MGWNNPLCLSSRPIIVWAIIITGANLYNLYILYRCLYRRLFPRPLPGIPYNQEATRSILGDVPSMLSDERGPMDWLLDQARRHNSPICQVFLRPFSKPFVVISDFREARDVMVRRKEWDRSDFSIDLLGGIAPNHHINMRTGPEWKAHRRLLSGLMMPSFLNSVAGPNIYDATLDLISLWEEKDRLAQGRPFSAADDIFYASLDAVLQFSFGSSFPHRAIPPQKQLLSSLVVGDNNAPLDQTVDFALAPLHEAIVATLDASDVVGELMSSPFPRLSWWIRSKMPHEATMIRLRHDYIKEQVLQAVERLGEAEDAQSDETRIKSAVDLMMRSERRMAEKEGRQPVYWSPSILDEVSGFVVARHDTTSTTLLWGIKFLSDSQDYQSRLRAILRQVHAEAWREKRLPSANEIVSAEVPFLEAVIAEILRLGNTLPVLDRQALCDTELFGHHIPKGTVVMMLNRGPTFTEPGFDIVESVRSVSSQKLKHDRRGVLAWSSDGMDEFRPERWLTKVANENIDESGSGSGGGGDDDEAVFNSMAGPFLPFGSGARGCFGRRLAYMEMRIVLTLIIWRFRLRECPKELSGYRAIETLTHKPQQCYVRLERL